MLTRRIIIVLLVSMLFSIAVNGEKASKFNLRIQSGAVYPYSGFEITFNPALNLGLGLSYDISPKMSIIFDFNHYLFIPTNKYAWFWRIGNTLLKLDTPDYVGDFTDEFYDFLLELKIKRPLERRLSPYLLIGAGATYRRQFSEWVSSIYGDKLYFYKSIFYLVDVGLGFDYQVDRRTCVFIEVDYAYCFFKFKEQNTGVVPVKFGIYWRL